MRSTKPVSVGSLAEWLDIISFAEFYPALPGGVTEETLRQQYEVVATHHLEKFNMLCAELSPSKRLLTMTDAQQLHDFPHEQVLCLWQDEVLIATAQASLMFPGGVPTVHISDVVVTEAERGKGFGKLTLLLIFRFAKGRWWPQYRPLRFEHTSRVERGTRGFYEGLGFVPTETVRYTKGG